MNKGRHALQMVGIVAIWGLCVCDSQAQSVSPQTSREKMPQSSYDIEAAYLFERGTQRFSDGEYTKAVTLFSRVIRLTPHDISSRISLCRALYKAKQPVLATQVCKETFAYAPGDLDVLAKIAALLIEAGHHRDAIEPLQQALVKAPDDTRFQDLLALADKDGSAAIGGRKEVWISQSFPCRAISTMRFRPCRFEPNGDGGYKLRFKSASIACNEVLFDDNGDPSVLKKCRSGWLRIPSTNKLFPDKDNKVWSGSKQGWGSYCCPGMWLQAPKSLQNN